jgi:hypothetical protein
VELNSELIFPYYYVGASLSWLRTYMVTFVQYTNIARHVMCRINAYFSSVTPHNVDVIPLVTFMTVLEFYALTLFSYAADLLLAGNYNNGM